jgi:hypothetical protein
MLEYKLIEVMNMSEMQIPQNFGDSNPIRTPHPKEFRIRGNRSWKGIQSMKEYKDSGVHMGSMTRNVAPEGALGSELKSGGYGRREKHKTSEIRVGLPG